MTKYVFLVMMCALGVLGATYIPPVWMYLYGYGVGYVTSTIMCILTDMEAHNG